MHCLSAAHCHFYLCTWSFLKDMHSRASWKMKSMWHCLHFTYVHVLLFSCFVFLGVGVCFCFMSSGGAPINNAKNAWLRKKFDMGAEPAYLYKIRSKVVIVTSCISSWSSLSTQKASVIRKKPLPIMSEHHLPPALISFRVSTYQSPPVAGALGAQAAAH